MTNDEMMFFSKLPNKLPPYELLRERLLQAYPQMQLKVTATQISFRNRYVFAMVSLPWRRVKGWPEEYMLVSFGLGHRSDSPRIAQAVEAYPNRWTHHVIVERTEQIDDELMSLIDEAYSFSMTK